MSTSPYEQLSGSPGCFICDNNGTNPRSLKLTLLWDAENGTVRVPIRPDQTWCGYDNVVHGGLVASVLDEAMAWVIRQQTGEWAFTADYHIRYKLAVQPDTDYVAVARATEIKRRRITAQAELSDAEGRVIATAEARFLPAVGMAEPRKA